MDLDNKGKGAVEGENAVESISSSARLDSDTKTEWSPVKIEECLSLLTSITTIEYNCPKCDKNVYANK